MHWGATSQDVIDTALVLELRAAIDALLADLDRAIKGFTTLAGRHRRTLSVARTLLQHALPMPFGLKLAGYAAALARSRERLTRLRREALVLQFGGAAGTLAALGEHGFGVSERLAALLDLPLPDAPWHTHRDRLAEIAACFGILAGTCGKIARDVTLMMQTEVGEAFEPGAPGRGGSSTLPHKRNPVGAAAALSAATVAPNLVATLLAAQVQEHERAPGGWHTEWMTFPALALVTSGALAAVVEIAQGLEIDVERLRANLELTGGQIMAEAVSFALAEKIGRAEAHALVRELSQQAAQEKRAAQGGAARRHAREVAARRHRDRKAVHPTHLSGLGADLHRPPGGRQARCARRAGPNRGRRHGRKPDSKAEPTPCTAKWAARRTAIRRPGRSRTSRIADGGNSPKARAARPEPPPPPDKLQWPGTLTHVFTNATPQGEPPPPDRDKLKFS